MVCYFDTRSSGLGQVGLDCCARPMDWISRFDTRCSGIDLRCSARRNQMARCFAIGSGPRYMIRVKLFLHVARFRKHTDMRELHSKRVQLRAKRVRQNLMPRATAYFAIRCSEMGLRCCARRDRTVRPCVALLAAAEGWACTAANDGSHCNRT